MLRAGDETMGKRLSQYLRKLAAQLIDQDRPADAVPVLEEAVTLQPDAADALANLGLALSRLKRNEEAVARYEQALALNGDIPELHTNLGAALLNLGRADDAANAHRRALQLRPDWHLAKTNLAIALAHLERTDEALELHEAVLRDHPDDPNALFNRGLIRLSRGDFAGGWRDYEAQIARPGTQRASLVLAAAVERGGSGRQNDPHSRGTGARRHDPVRPLRAAPARARANVVVQCDALLTRLLRNSFPAITVVARGEPLPAFDAHVPVMSLPHVFGTTLETVPRDVPYLAAPETTIDAWRRRIRNEEATFRVGLVWAGNAGHYNDRNRSIPVEQPAACPRSGPRRAAVEPPEGRGRRAARACDVGRSRNRPRP